MKRVIQVLLICVIMAGSLYGCGDKKAVGQENTTVEEDVFGVSGNTPTIEQTAVIEGGLSAGALLEEEVWRDNTLDEYTAVMHFPLQPEQPEGEIGGGREIALGDSCGAVFKKHLFGSGGGHWDELKIVTDQGEENSLRLAFKKDTFNQAFGMGSIIGSDHFLMWDWMEDPEGQGWKYQFFEIDEEQQIVRTIDMDFLSGDGYESPYHIMVDKSGNIHFSTTYMGPDPEEDPNRTEKYYFVTDSDGNLLAKYEYPAGRVEELVSLYDGRVAMLERILSDEGRSVGSCLEYADVENGEMVQLAEFGKDAPKALWETFSFYYTLWDDETLLYADGRGLHFADLSGKAMGDVYIWSNHGIRFSAMEEIRIREDGRINLIYSDYTGDLYLLCLEPTRERVEIQEIVLAVAPYMKNIYYPTVAEFNKKYPAYHIELKTDYDETALLTELTAGKGPVLIDTGLTGFDSHKKLWMPLGGLFAGEEWEEVLIPKAMELGEIDGVLYGVVSSFGLETVVIPEDKPSDWNYEGFLDRIESSPAIEAIFNGQNDVWSFVSCFLIHGLEDNYLLDVASGATYFDSDEFRRVLRLGTTYCSGEEWVEPGTSMLDGRVFCNTVDITRPELIDLYRICYGEDANYVGYPSRYGSAHFIYGNAPLAVRITASEEEQKVAASFLRMLLSQDGQMEGIQDVNFMLSVRKDVLEEQINQVNEDSVPYAHGFDQITLGDNYDREYDARILYKLLESARPKRYFPRELNAIMVEEMGEYLTGVITEDVLIERLTRRVKLYLAEQY